jgi:hypothetical protein
MLKPKSSQSSGCTHIHQKKPKKFEENLSERKLMAAVFWDRSADSGIHATRDNNDVRSLLQNSKITA